jgi:hypothetical protein
VIGRPLRRLALGVLLCLAAATAAANPAPAQAPVRWLFTSDVHFNPLDDPKLAVQLANSPVTQWDAVLSAQPEPFASYGSDSNAALLQSALARMKQQVPDAPVVFISGDFLPHHFREQWNAAASDRSDAAFEAFAEKTIAYLAHEFDRTFPRAQFVITLGNNDSACGDYLVAPNSPFLGHFAAAWEPLVNRNGTAPDFARAFAVDGNYVTTVPGGTRVIAVNSNAWSAAAKNDCDPGGTAAGDVMTWFEHAVAQAPSGAHTWALLHIPPGIDAYASLRSGKPVPFYRPDLLARMRAVHAADGAPLRLIVAGHLHNDGYRIVDATPLLLVPSISPNHANNPAFFVATIDPAASTIADYQAYYLDLASAGLRGTVAQWRYEYDFDEAYALGSGGFSLPSLETIQKAIAADETIRGAAADRYVSGALVQAITDRTWRAYWCSNAFLEPASYGSCVRSSR